MPRKQVPIKGDEYGTARVRVWAPEGRTTISVDADLWRYFVKLLGSEQAGRDWIGEKLRTLRTPAGVTRSKAISREILAAVVRPELRGDK